MEDLLTWVDVERMSPLGEAVDLSVLVFLLDLAFQMYQN